MGNSTIAINARRNFLKFAGTGFAGATAFAIPSLAEGSQHSELAGHAQKGIFNVSSFGASGDGRTVDSPAINRAIDAAAASGGGMVHFPAGQYLCYSIRLKSNITLHLGAGAVVIAADPLAEGQSGGYDDPEPPQPWEAYQDFGHNHWHNSLIWGEGLNNISILGPGRIWGTGLVRANGPNSRNSQQRRIQGVGNKSIALKKCHNVLLKDFQILQGGWFGILATGVDNLTIDGLTIDTNRDGMDIDCCRNVRVTNCAVNS
ncbi:MAG: glycoside hydrolase family 28 protein, partial [Acidobacteriaceae bacterium]